MELLRFITCGSVDDGKSTLVGRLLWDTRSVPADQVAATERASRQRGQETLDLSLFTDGLRAEREQGITIDVAYRFFATPRRHFQLGDCPGHFQFTRNMVTGASDASLALLLVDARRGPTEQTWRHLFLLGLLGLPQVVVCVNKMDAVGYAPDVFAQIATSVRDYARSLSLPALHCLPISALVGDNVTAPSAALGWHRGPTLLQLLEEAPVRPAANVGARLPIQHVVRLGDNSPLGARGLLGQMAGGVLRIGDEIRHWPSGLAAKIRALEAPSGSVTEAFAPMSVLVTLDRELEVARGDLLASVEAPPQVTQDIEAIVCHLETKPLELTRRLLLQHTTLRTRCVIREAAYRIDVATQRHEPVGEALGANDIVRVTLRTQAPLAVDRYAENRRTGAFILIDEATNATVAAGLIL